MIIIKKNHDCSYSRTDRTAHKAKTKYLLEIVGKRFLISINLFRFIFILLLQRCFHALWRFTGMRSR